MSRAVAWSAALIAALAVAGCGEVVAEPQTVLTDEMAGHDGQVCPRKLPAGEDPAGYGFGIQEPADKKPSLLTPDAGWVCRFEPVRAGSGPEGGGTKFVWQRKEDPVALTPAQLAAATEYLAELQPQRQDACPANLGPRILLVFSHVRDLTGVVIDDFGCNSVRLTDQPFTRAPGDPGQQGTVSGTLTGPEQLLTLLKAVQSS